MDSISESLIAAQNKAESLFAEVVDRAMIQAGKLESELTAEIHSLARSRFGLRRHWHKRIARSGVVSRNSNEAIGECASRLLDDPRRLVSPYTPLQCPHRLSLFSCCS
jgi:hypothetical protein